MKSFFIKIKESAISVNLFQFYRMKLKIFFYFKFINQIYEFLLVLTLQFGESKYTHHNFSSRPENRFFLYG